MRLNFTISPTLGFLGGLGGINSTVIINVQLSLCIITLICLSYFRSKLLLPQVVQCHMDVPALVMLHDADIPYESSKHF